MLKIYNPKAITRNERFQNAVVVGLGVTVAVTVLYVAITRLTHIYIPALLALGGYGIGFAIQKYGRGIQLRFSYLAMGLALVMIIVCDLLTLPGGFKGIIANLSGVGFDSLWNIGYRALAVILAYRYARIV